ncbi:MAG: ABC transporter substrate-binding protein [Deltaproteobacteria bacterium]|nr:ABC transporter substrate-binding protein [Deltaproteobacteria bacterium]
MKAIIWERLLFLITIGFVLVGCLLLLFTSCSRDSGEMQSYTIADNTGDWGYPSPYTHYSRGPGYIMMSFIFETLVWKDAADFVPQLASKWEYHADENAYVFRLQKDVQWHDGVSFTAEDVVFTFQYTKEHPYAWVDNTIVKSVEAVDPYTVKIYLSRPYAPFLHDVAGTQPIMPKHIWEGVDQPDQFTGPEAVIGTGPYTLADYSKGHGTYLYKPFDMYYLGKPAVEEIKVVKISAEMIPAALKGGSADAGSIPPEVVSDMKEAGLSIITAPVAWNAKMTINHKKSPLSSKKFRQALAYAIDRDALVQITQRGHAVAGSPGMVPPTSAWYNPKTPQYRYDPSLTGRLLEELGYKREGAYFSKDGKELRLELMTTAQFKDVGHFVAQQLTEAGIRIDFKTLEAKTVDAKVAAWDFNLSIYGHGGLYEPSVLNRVITGSGFNSARYDANKTLNQLLKTQITEMDPDKRKRIIFEIQELYAEELPALTLYYPQWYWAHDGNIDLYFTRDGVASGVPLPLNRMAFVK